MIQNMKVIKGSLQLTLFLLFAVTLISCGEQAQPGVKVSPDVFQSQVNDKPIPDNVNLKTDKSLLNRDYPIEIALYSDGQWFYDLPNLGTGRGTFSYDEEKGVLKLHASRDLFDINIEVSSVDETGSSFYLSFRDRHGLNVLTTE
jgi:hypothetical protein